ERGSSECWSGPGSSARSRPAGTARRTAWRAWRAGASAGRGASPRLRRVRPPRCPDPRGSTAPPEPRVDLGEDGVLRLEPGELRLVHRSPLQLPRQAVEPAEMLVHPAAGVLDRGPLMQDERPVGGLRQEELAARLGERPTLDGGRTCEPGGERDHPAAGVLERRLYPVVGGVEPHVVVSALAPARRRRLGDLPDRMLLEVLPRAHGADAARG